MNFSKTYIKMCEKAAKLQKKWQPTAGDYILHKYTIFGEEIDKEFWPKNKREQLEILCYRPQNTKDFWVGTANGKSLVLSAKDFTKKTHIWLPRQDQLWEMLKTIKSIFLSRYAVGVYEIEIADYSERWTGKEIEPLLLQVCMFLLHNKSWNGKEWINATNLPDSKTRMDAVAEPAPEESVKQIHYKDVPSDDLTVKDIDLTVPMFQEGVGTEKPEESLAFGVGDIVRVRWAKDSVYKITGVGGELGKIMFRGVLGGGATSGSASYADVELLFPLSRIPKELKLPNGKTIHCEPKGDIVETNAGSVGMLLSLCVGGNWEMTMKCVLLTWHERSNYFCVGLYLPSEIKRGVWGMDE